MRLSEDQANAIMEIMSKELVVRPFEVFLYGSRIEDEKKGGDIDLFVLQATSWSMEDQKKIFRILALLKSHKHIGDRKINLSLISEAEKTSDPFWKTITNFVSLGRV